MIVSERIQRWGRLGLRIFILAAVAFLSATTTMRLAIQGSEVKVPDVVKMRATDADTKLGALGLGMKIEDRVFSELPADAVVRQSPRANESVKRTQRVHVVLSLGPQRVSVPSLEGKSLRSARIELLQGGLQVGHLSSLHLPGMDADSVVQQNPGPQAATLRGPHVDMLVSLGDPETAWAMPDLAGLTLGEAERRIAAAGLVLTGLHSVVGPVETRGIILSQSIARGSRVTPGAKVELQVGE
jgi:eukaryotic-like serine/threonine-protein kinase